MTDRTGQGDRGDFPADTVLGHFERRGNVYTDWRRFLVDVVEHDVEQSAWYLARKERYDALEQRLETAAPEVGVELDRLFWAHHNDTIDHAALLAYALARTAPAGLEEWDDWLARARAFAGLEGGVEGQS